MKCKAADYVKDSDSSNQGSDVESDDDSPKVRPNKKKLDWNNFINMDIIGDKFDTKDEFYTKKHSVILKSRVPINHDTYMFRFDF